MKKLNININEIIRMIKEKKLLIVLSFLFGFGLITFAMTSCVKHEPKTILIVSGWQDVNIGDIAHTPGLIHVLETYLPETNYILWEKTPSDRVGDMLKKHYPNLKIIYGDVDKEGNVQSPEVLDAFKQADMMIHGSGPYVVGQPHLQAWVNKTDKPFGIFGVTIEVVNSALKALLEKASFIYTRETQSLKVLKEAGISGKHVSFAPDATFFLNIRDDEKAKQFLKENGLEDGKFICAIPRLRLTPYFLVKRSSWSEKRIKEVEDYNNLRKEEDHIKLREAIIDWVRETGNKVLLCPEMTYQVDIIDELLYDPLPEDVKPFVVRRGYWMSDEAASTYARSAGVVSFDCHSPIIAAANGIPFMYLRQPEDTSKGQMYYDLKFSDWIFEIEKTKGVQISNRLREIRLNESKSKQKIKEQMKEISNIYEQSCVVVNEILGYNKK